tara:strand:+ start:2002 stop:2319 length:318 start_codon:yes stop_codon:yes gene_type:complete
MGKYTQGEWSDHYAKLAPVSSVAVWSKQGDMVRRVALCGIHEGIDLDEAEANGRLIAAAPDLLEAAKAFDDAVDSASEAGHYINDPRLRAAVRLAREAIEKAEGV